MLRSDLPAVLGGWFIVLRQRVLWRWHRVTGSGRVSSGSGGISGGDGSRITPSAGISRRWIRRVGVRGVIAGHRGHSVPVRTDATVTLG